MPITLTDNYHRVILTLAITNQNILAIKIIWDQNPSCRLRDVKNFYDEHYGPIRRAAQTLPIYISADWVRYDKYPNPSSYNPNDIG